ncbi:MAG: hypothetical protein AB8B77_05790, partial [Alphaproteobacteria bacterium]
SKRNLTTSLKYKAARCEKSSQNAYLKKEKSGPNQFNINGMKRMSLAQDNAHHREGERKHKKTCFKQNAQNKALI